jgi:hypothetical protein
MSAALDAGQEGWVEWEPGHGAAIASVGADSNVGPDIWHSVRFRQARPIKRRA